MANAKVAKPVKLSAIVKTTIDSLNTVLSTYLSQVVAMAEVRVNVQEKLFNAIKALRAGCKDAAEFHKAWPQVFGTGKVPKGQVKITGALADALMKEAHYADGVGPIKTVLSYSRSICKHWGEKGVHDAAAFNAAYNACSPKAKREVAPKDAGAGTVTTGGKMKASDVMAIVADNIDAALAGLEQYFARAKDSTATGFVFSLKTHQNARTKAKADAKTKAKAA